MPKREDSQEDKDKTKVEDKQKLNTQEGEPKDSAGEGENKDTPEAGALASNNPVSQAEEGLDVQKAGELSDLEEVGKELAELLRADPDLANKIADLIEKHYGEYGGAGMEFNNAGGPAGATGTPNAIAGNMGGGAPAAGAMGPVGGAPPQAPQAMQIPAELLERLNNVEKFQGQSMLQQELNETKQEYESLKEHFPNLPDLDDKELLQIAYEKGGMPLKDALMLWAMNKMREGEGSYADRLLAHKMQEAKGRNLPRVEGKGGAIPTGAEQPPQNMKEARMSAKELLRAKFASQPG